MRWPTLLEEALVDAQNFAEFLDIMCATSVDIGQVDLTVALTGILELMGIHEDLPNSGGASWIRVDPNNDVNVSNINNLSLNPNSSIISPMSDNDGDGNLGGLYTNNLNVRDPELAIHYITPQNYPAYV